MRTGIYGGTFNPIHLSHMHILREFLRRLSLDRALLIPTGAPPHKQALALAPAEDRLAMCRLAAAELGPQVEVCPIEIRRAGKSYTADTLEELRVLYPEDEFFLLMGEDMFLTVDRWVRPEVICAQANLCASPRSEDGLRKLLSKQKELEQNLGARCFVEDIPYVEGSSTQVRELAGQGKSLAGLVPPPVEDYIRTHGIYQREEGPHDL